MNIPMEKVDAAVSVGHIVYILTTRVYIIGSGLSTGSFGLFLFPLLCKKFQHRIGNPNRGGTQGVMLMLDQTGC